MEQRVSSSNRHPHGTLSAFLLFALVVAAIYGNTVTFDFLMFDDGVYVAKNEHVNNGLSLNSVLWAFQINPVDAENTHFHPLTWISHMLDCELFGLRAGLHHVVNGLIHLLNGFLLFLILKASTQEHRKSMMVALLFLIHPMNVESVAWISERKSLLSAMFGFGAILSWVVYCRIHRKRYLLISLMTFVLSLLSKPVFVTLPFALLLMDYWPLNRIKSNNPVSRHSPRPLSRLVIEKLPFLVISILLMAIFIQAVPMLSSSQVGMGLRLANATTSYVEYIRMGLFPVNLAMFYPYPTQLPPVWQIAVSAAVILIVTFVAVTRRVSHPYLLFGWLFYLGTLVPSTGILQTGSWPRLADRFIYIPFIGLFIVAVWGVSDIWSRWHLSTRSLKLITVAVIPLLGAAAWTQCQYWKHSGILAYQALQVTEDNYIAHNHLGCAYVDQKAFDKAIFHLKEAMKIKPDLPSTEHTLGYALVESGHLDEGIRHLERVVKNYPGLVPSRVVLSDALIRAGRTDAAMKQLQVLVRIAPREPESYYLLGVLHEGLGDSHRASTAYRKAIAISPSHYQAHRRLGMLGFRQGDRMQAARHLKKALSLNPNDTETRKILHRIGSNPS